MSARTCRFSNPRVERWYTPVISARLAYALLRACISSGTRVTEKTRKEYAAVPVLIIPRIIRRFLSPDVTREERPWKRVFHSKRLTIKFLENKTVIPAEKCGFSRKIQRTDKQNLILARCAHQFVINNRVCARAFLPREVRHTLKRTYCNAMYIYVYIYTYVPIYNVVHTLYIYLSYTMKIDFAARVHYRYNWMYIAREIQPTAAPEVLVSALIRFDREIDSRKHGY